MSWLDQGQIYENGVQIYKGGLFCQFYLSFHKITYEKEKCYILDGKVLQTRHKVIKCTIFSESCVYIT